MSARVTGRCYCGATLITAQQLPKAVAYCHCVDCKRISGAPVAAFAAFNEEDVAFEPSQGKIFSNTVGVVRSFCEQCGTPLTARYDYLPGRVYIGLGVIDQRDELVPEIHSHASSKLPWLDISDDCQRFSASARETLND